MPVPAFSYQLPHQQVLFGAGCVDRVGDEAAGLGIGRALVLSSPGRAARATEIGGLLGGRRAGVSDAAGRNISVSAFEAAAAAVADCRADGLVVIGGGSAIGLGKALAANLGLAFIAVVTTYSGSELSPSWRIGAGAGVGGRTGKHSAALPGVVFYDPLLTIDLPPAVSAASGMNAMAHAVESLYGAEANPVSERLASEAIRLLAAHLPLLAAAPDDREARAQCLLAAWFAAAFRGGLAIEHRIAQTLRRVFDLSHAEAHAVVLPHAVAFNREAAPEAMALIAGALGCKDAAAGLYDLNGALGLKRGLREMGLAEADLEAASEAVLAGEFFNPRPAGKAEIRALLQDIYEGRRP